MAGFSGTMAYDEMQHQALRAYSWADTVYSSVGCTAPPVDLFAIARHRRVNRAGFRLMVPRGVLVPVAGGFELFLRDPDSRDLNLEVEEQQNLMSHRQRFNFAHEIAHTFFFRDSKAIPAPITVGGNPRKLEEICDGAAGRILVPSDLLRVEIKRELLGNCERIDSDFVRAMVAKFRASHDVVINRLRMVESENVFARCILLVRRSDGEARIRACYMGVTLLSSLPAPNIYDPVANWFQEVPRAVTESDGGGKWEMTGGRRKLEMEKIPLGHSGDFLLQIDDPAHRAPTSK